MKDALRKNPLRKNNSWKLKFPVIFIMAAALAFVSCTGSPKPEVTGTVITSSEKQLNTLVTELINYNVDEKPVTTSSATLWKEFSFALSKPGWVFLRIKTETPIAGTIWLTIDKTAIGNAQMECDEKNKSQTEFENMRYLSQGQHVVKIWTKGTPALKNITVRKIPEIFAYMIRCFDEEQPSGCYQHKWDFLKKHMLPNCNVLCSYNKNEYMSLAKQWRQQGGKWFVDQKMVQLRDPGCNYYEYWKNILSQPQVDAVIHDEVTRDDYSGFERWKDSINKITRDKGLNGKDIYLYCFFWDCMKVLDENKCFSIDEKQAQSGIKSLCCKSYPGGLLTVRQNDIILDPNKNYMLSVNLRSQAEPVNAQQDAAGNDGTYSGVFIINKNWLATMGEMRAPQDTQGWQSYSKTFKPVPSADGKYQLVICSPVNASLWVDSICLEEVSESGEKLPNSKNLIINGGFENDWNGWGNRQKQEAEFRMLLDMVMRNHLKLALEAYFDEFPTLEKAENGMSKRLAGTMEQWKSIHPGIEEKICLVLGAGNGALNYSNDSCPSVNYKVLLDMQFNTIANDKAFNGLGGVGLWAMHYLDEELVRWYGQLFRHYLIEGKTERLTSDPYILTHLKNPGFEDGKKDWQITEAFPGSVKIIPPVKTRKINGASLLKLIGNNVKPNITAQEIKNLSPGRLYSLKLYTADKGLQAVETSIDINLKGVEVLKGKGYDRLWTAGWDKNKDRPSWTMHYRVFRAVSTEGELILSDWNSSKTGPLAKPGGELLVDFVQIEPYFPEE